MRRLAPTLYLLTFAAAPGAVGQDLLNDNIEFSGLTLNLVEYAQLAPTSRIISMTTQPTGDPRLFVSVQEGQIHALNHGEAASENNLWFDVGTAVEAATGRQLNFDDNDSGRHGGLRSLAFHPEFAANGKFYTSTLEDRPSVPIGHAYLGASESHVEGDSVLVEWTYNHGTGHVRADSYRELFRVSMPVYDHPIKQIKFNELAKSGDEDYGLLYITHGDGSFQSAIVGGGQHPDDALGKVLRIDPLSTDSARYSVPHSPFADDSDTLDEIYALGFRNPHNLSFALDERGESHLIVADVGRDNIEEINLVVGGGDYGWSEREGTFVHRNQGGGSINGVAPLPLDEAANGYRYPAAQFDHDSPPGASFTGVAIAGAHVIDNGSELDGEYIFGDFGLSGRIYHTSFDDMLAAVTHLDPSDPARDSPSDLTQASISQAQLAFDHDGDPSTTPRPFDTFTDLLGTTRSDFRFGKGKQGELFISSKQDSKVYLVTNSLNSLDCHVDGILDIGDLNCTAPDQIEFLLEELNLPIGDLNGDGAVDFIDFLRLSNNFGNAGEYTDGDFDKSGVLGFGDFVILARNFGRRASSVAVPEPTSLGWLVLGVGFARARCWGAHLWRCRRCHRGSKDRTDAGAVNLA